MKQNFNKLSKLLRVILLIIPFVNWIIELCVRWETYVQKKSIGYLVFAIIVTLGFGIAWGFIDAIAIAVTDKMILTE